MGSICRVINRRCSLLLFISMAFIAGSICPAYANVVYNAAMITFLGPPTATHDCVYFTLSGVSQADPLVPNNAWFAMPSSHYGFAMVYAALLSAKISGTTLQVVTTGALAGGSCGNYAGVDSVVAM